MLEAQLHGKLTRDQENLEDILTSNVFGSIKYISAEKGLTCILRNAENGIKEFPLKKLDLAEKVKYGFDLDE